MKMSPDRSPMLTTYLKTLKKRRSLNCQFPVPLPSRNTTYRHLWFLSETTHSPDRSSGRTETEGENSIPLSANAVRNVSGSRPLSSVKACESEYAAENKSGCSNCCPNRVSSVARILPSRYAERRNTTAPTMRQIGIAVMSVMTIFRRLMSVKKCPPTGD